MPQLDGTRLAHWQAQREEIRKHIVPGSILLVTGPRGSGKFAATVEAFAAAGPYRSVFLPELDEAGLDRVFAGLPRPGAGVVFHEPENMNPDLVSKLRHFIVTTSRPVALVAFSREALPEAIRSTFIDHVEFK